MKKLLTCLLILFAFTANAENPTLKIKQFNGEIFDLSKQKGKITIINFWAHWCSNCKRELPILNEVYKENKSRGLEVIAISIDDEKHRSNSEKFAKTLAYPTALQKDVITASFSKPKFVPTYYVVGENGEFLGEIFAERKLTKRRLNKVVKKHLESLSGAR